MITAADVVDPRRDTADPMVRMQFLGGMYTVFTGAAAAIAELGDGASVADVVTHLLPDADRTAIDAGCYSGRPASTRARSAYPTRWPRPTGGSCSPVKPPRHRLEHRRRGVAHRHP